MTIIERLELAIRRAASQMPNHQSRAFRLAADEISMIKDEMVEMDILEDYRRMQREGD